MTSMVAYGRIYLTAPPWLRGSMDGCSRERHKGCLGKGTAQKEQTYALFQVVVTCDPAGERLRNPFFLPRPGTSFRQMLVYPLHATSSAQNGSFTPLDTPPVPPLPRY